jgi:hypothetical protein
MSRRRCLEALWELGLLLCGRDENYYREKIRDYNKDNEGYLRYITIEESKNKIHLEDIAKFVLSPLLFIAGKEIDIPDNGLSDDETEKAVLDRSEEILHKKLRRYIEIFQKSDKWLKKILYLPFCGRLLECIICLDSFLESSKAVDLNFVIYKPDSLKDIRLFKNIFMEVLVPTSALLTRMIDLSPSDLEEGKFMEFLSRPEKEMSKKFYKDLNETINLKNLNEFNWISYVFPNSDARDIRTFTDKLNGIPKEMGDYITTTIRLFSSGHENISEEGLLRFLITLCAELTQQRKLLEYIVLSNIAQDGVPVLSSHKWLIRPREDSTFAGQDEDMKELRKNLDSLTEKRLLHKIGDNSYETSELDGIVYLDQVVIKRLNSVAPCSELSFPAYYEAVGIVEVTTGGDIENDMRKLEGIVNILNHCLGESNRMFFGLLGIKDKTRASTDSKLVTVVNLGELMRIEGRLRIYRDILKILEKRTKENYPFII